jgi:hypothetical protein
MEKGILKVNSLALSIYFPVLVQAQNRAHNGQLVLNTDSPN